MMLQRKKAEAAVRVKIACSKTVASLLFAVLLVNSDGCMTYSTVQDARGHPEKDLWARQPSVTDKKPGQPHPAYYLLLPLTVPADIATSPIQGIGFIFWGWVYRPLETSTPSETNSK